MVMNLNPPKVKPETKPPVYGYTGNYQYVDEGIDDNGVQNWYIRLLTSGTLTFQRVPSQLDIFLLGGGGGGDKGYAYDNSGYSGEGGHEGSAVNQFKVAVAKNTEYPIVIGAGGATRVAGGATTGFGFSAAGGRAGGCYAGGSGISAFNEGKLLFGGNGGSGGYSEINYVLHGPQGGGKPYGGGGGNVGSYTAGTTSTAGASAAANTGGGGGGGGGGTTYGDYKDGGSGGSGIVIIRNAR